MRKKFATISLLSIAILASSYTSIWSQYVPLNPYAANNPYLPPRPTTQAPYKPYVPSTPTSSQSYSDYYSSQLKKYRRPPVSATQYTIDKHFYHRPTLSPYLNLTRGSGAYTSNYHSYVRPELQRRANATTTPTTGKPIQTTPTSPYFNKYYNGRAKLGLQP